MLLSSFGFRNKVHIVKAGLLKKLPRLMDLSTSHDLALLLLSVSLLANTDFPLSTADLLPFLVATLGNLFMLPGTKILYLFLFYA